MVITILSAESLGARGLACSIQLKERTILIDPGIALGWSRHGLLPHPFQTAVGAGLRQGIREKLNRATDVVFSHYHGDHCPLAKPNPYQLELEEAREGLSRCRVWARGAGNLSPAQRKRRDDLAGIRAGEWRDAEGMRRGPLAFSLPVPHGEGGGAGGMVMMSRIEEDGVTFVHASDIQLLDRATVETIIRWKPDIVLASGPPLYHYTSPSHAPLRDLAWANALELSGNTATLIIDHHLLRSGEGIEWLESLRRAAPNRVLCAAEFMEQEPLFLEAWRSELYEWIPVPGTWHEAYRRGETGTDPYRTRGWREVISRGRVRPCGWYSCCPIRRFTDSGALDRFWVERYCLVNNRRCVRYRMEEEGRPHPDTLLPDGRMMEDLP
ncbi:MAG: hypothetical protein JW838_14205 [Spirochaetes bacterium]|nr:hypothetical protein [Spirochaetota bacterium]